MLHVIVGVCRLWGIGVTAEDNTRCYAQIHSIVSQAPLVHLVCALNNLLSPVLAVFLFSLVSNYRIVTRAYMYVPHAHDQCFSSWSGRCAGSVCCHLCMTTSVFTVDKMPVLSSKRWYFMVRATQLDCQCCGSNLLIVSVSTAAVVYTGTP